VLPLRFLFDQPFPIQGSQADLPAWQGLPKTQNYQRSGTSPRLRPPFARNGAHRCRNVHRPAIACAIRPRLRTD
jgi:hypothetical protein